MTDVIERLRAANPLPQSPPPSIEDVWRRIEQGPGARPNHLPDNALAPKVSGWRAGGRGLAFAVSALATFAVAALAVVLLGHGGNNGAGRPQSGGGPATIVHAQKNRSVGSTAALRTELRSLRGRPVVILAWATWCPPCRKQLPVFASAWAHYRRRAAFLGVDVDDPPGDAKAYLAKHPVGYPNYRATLRQLQSILRVRVVGLPATFFISPAGKMLYSPFGSYSSQALRREVEMLLAKQAQQLAQSNEGTARAARSRSSRVRIAPSLLKYFAVFRNHRRGRDVNSMRPELARTSAAQGLNVADAILVPIGPGNGTWVIPGATQVCIFDDTGSGVCNSPTDGPGAPTAGGFYMRTSPGSLGGGYSILGLVPDGNSTVTLSLSDGSSRTVPVVDNVYSVSGLPAAPTAVKLKDAAGAIKTVPIG